MSTRPLFWSVRLTRGGVDLCNACFAVLVQEGSLAGDPKEEAIPASDVLRASPLTSGPARCDVCTAREEHELHRPVLQAPPARLAVPPLLVGPLSCSAEPREPAAWEGLASSAEREGNDSPRACPERCDAPACRESCAG